MLTGLYPLLSSWPALAQDSELVVRPLPEVAQDARRKAIVIGWNGDPEDLTAIEFEETPEGLGGNVARENYTIRLVAQTLADDGSMPSAVAGAYALMAEVAKAVASIRPAMMLGGVKLLRATLGGGTLVTDVSQLKATLATGLVVDAFTASDTG